MRGDRIVARVGRTGDRLIAEWIGIGRLTVGRDGSGARFVANPNVDPVLRAKVEDGAVRILLRTLEGKVGLHGCAVAVANRAVVLIGDAGDGKSTLGAALCSRIGAELLADDMIALDHADGWYVVPSERRHFLDRAAAEALRLFSSSHELPNAKAAVRPSKCATHDMRLKAIVRLSFDDAVSMSVLQPLGFVDAIAALVPQTVRFVMDDEVHHQQEFDHLAALVSGTPTFNLLRPRNYDLLPSTVATIAGLLGSEES